MTKKPTKNKPNTNERAVTRSGKPKRSPPQVKQVKQTKQAKKTIQFRPPIVAFMGHIDHGKTSLLDKIRSTNLWSKETGGITQHISSYQVKINNKKDQGSLITFIDTPGHAAFVKMRAHGNSVTNLAVLVIADNEGIKTQTKECIKLIKNSNTPVIIALNKIDLPTANLDNIRAQLSEQDLTPEKFGGQTACIEVSAKTGKGIDKLLEMILLNAEIMELKSLPNNPLKAVIIESRLDKSRGPLVTAIIKEGSLKVGDTVFSKDSSCKVKSILDFNNKAIQKAGPSVPVQIMGFNKVQSVGNLITSEKHYPDSPKPANLPQLKSDEPKLSIIVKADTKGTLEALLSNFTNNIYLVSSGVGPVTDNDIFMAKASSAQIFTFNLPVPKLIKNLAQNEKVLIFESKIIYEIIEEIEKQVLKMLEPTIDETITGEGIIKAEFNINKLRIAGLACTKGVLGRGDSIHLKRDDEIIKNSKIEGIKQGKEDIEKVKQGNDCGMIFKPYIDFKINDVIIAYNKSKESL